MSITPDALLALLDRHLQSIWDGDVETYRATTAEDVSFYEWYISPQRIDGLDFHLREIAVHGAVIAGSDKPGAQRIEHEVLQPRVQVYGDTAIITYTLFIRAVGPDGLAHKHITKRASFTTSAVQKRLTGSWCTATSRRSPRPIACAS